MAGTQLFDGRALLAPLLTTSGRIDLYIIGIGVRAAVAVVGPRAHPNILIKRLPIKIIAYTV
jgi:hypothetical protein